MLPDVPAVHRAFDYRVPERWRHQVGVGTRVRVRLHGRAVGGWVLDADVEPPEGVELLALVAVSGLGPPPAVLALAEWAAWRWAGPVSSFLGAASPKRNVRGLAAPPHPARARSLADPTGRGPLVPAGVLAEALARVGRPTLLVVPPAEDLLALVGAVLEHRGPGMLVLVPSTGWAERLGERLRRRGVDVARDWSEAAAGWPVVLGARSAAWAPMPELAAAVVLDGHDEAYRAERTPTYNAWEVAAERAARQGAPCLITSPCPTAVLAERCVRWSVPRPLERAGWPGLSLVDLRVSDPRTGLLTESVVRLARGVLGGADPLVCVLNRTGRARLLACGACGELARCERCGRPLSQVDERLVCPACEERRPVVCAACGATRLKVLRPGVARLREELEALLGVAVAEVAGPARSRRPVPVPDAPVLIGTEAVLHRARRAAAVAFLDFDQQLLAPRFGAAEEALALLARAGRLVGGRASAGGPPRVLVQTRLPDHEVLAAGVHGDPGRLVTSELALRHRLDLPPASALALVSGPGAPLYAAGLRGVEVADLGDGRRLVRASGHRVLCDALAAVPRPAARLRVEVDPIGV
ncbi:MAG: hypothetical protein ACLP9C_14635 [Acidimicrobiales bacterium]